MLGTRLLANVGTDLLPDRWTAERAPEALERGWLRLETDAIATPFQTYRWISTHYQAKPGNAVFAAGWKNGELAAVFPLAVNDGVMTWFGEALANYNAPLLARSLWQALTPKNVDRIWTAVREAVGHPHCSILRRQPESLAGLPNPFASWRSVREPTSAYALTLGSEWPAFYETLHSAATRKTLRKKQNALARLGAISIRIATDPGEAEELMRLLLHWKSEQVDAGGGRNNFADAAHRDLLAGYARTEAARMYVMALESEPVAIACVYLNGAEPILYQMAYAPGPAARYSPGRLLLNRIIEDSIADRSALLDFAVGDDLYKQDLCDRRVPLTTSLAVHSPAGWTSVALERAKLGAKAAIKASPAALRAAKRLHAYLGGRRAPAADI